MARVVLAPALDLARVSWYIAFASNPLDAPVLNDVTPWVKEARVTRGYLTSNPGQVRLVLDNRDRRFEPGYAASPYYPNVRSGKRVVGYGNWAGVDYPLVTAYVDNWPQQWDAMNIEVPLTATSGGRALKDIDFIEGAFPDQLTGARVDQILRAAGIAASDLVIDPGASVVPGIESFYVNALKHLTDVVTTEAGQVFIDALGRYVFHDRYHRRRPGQAITTFGDSTGELPYTALSPVDDIDRVRNQIAVTRRYPAVSLQAGVQRMDYTANGETQIREDATSKLSYQTRTLQIDVLTPSDNDAADRAEYELTWLKDALFHYTMLGVAPQLSPSSLWPFVLDVELNDRVRVLRRPRGGAVITTQQDYAVTSIEHVMTYRQWSTALGLEELRPGTTNDYWNLGTSQLGTNTVLAF